PSLPVIGTNIPADGPGWTAVGAGEPRAPASRPRGRHSFPRHQRNALTGGPDSEPQLGGPMVLGPPGCRLRNRFSVSRRLNRPREPHRIFRYPRSETRGRAMPTTGFLMPPDSHRTDTTVGPHRRWEIR